MQPYIWDWNPWADTVLDPYQALMVESMHPTDLGIFTHLKEALWRKYSEQQPLHENKLWRMDERLRELKGSWRLSTLKLPSPPYWQQHTGITAAKHRAAFQAVVACADGESIFMPDYKCTNRSLIRAIVSMQVSFPQMKSRFSACY